MNRDKQAHTLVKIRTILVIILFALLTSVVIELILAERTNALLQDTLQGTTSLVKQVVGPVIPPAPAPAQTVSPSAQSASAVKPASALSPSATNPTAPAPGTSTGSVAPSEAVPLVNTDLQKVYFVKAKMSESLAGARLAGTTGDVVSSSQFAWIQATEQGWKVAGALWYGWVAAIITVPLGMAAWRKRHSWHLFNKLVLKR